jgi:O-methyltransferase involved in polyketide biosynthesis
MARTDHDTWGPATSVGTTATLVATARGLATRAGLINDPLAEPLVRAVGIDFFTQVASGERAPRPDYRDCVVRISAERPSPAGTSARH